MASVKVNETSSSPQVMALVQQLAMKGKALEYAYIEPTTGNVTAYKAIGDSAMTVVVNKQFSRTPTDLPDSGTDNITSILDQDYYKRQLTAFGTQRSGFNYRNAWFIGGITVILLAALYGRKGRK